MYELNSRVDKIFHDFGMAVEELNYSLFASLFGWFGE